MWICLLHLFYSSLCDEETTTRAKLMLLLPNLPIYLSAIYEEVPGQQLTSIRPACNFVVSCSFFLSGLWSAMPICRPLVHWSSSSPLLLAHFITCCTQSCLRKVLECVLWVITWQVLFISHHHISDSIRKAPHSTAAVAGPEQRMNSSGFNFKSQLILWFN